MTEDTEQGYAQGWKPNAGDRLVGTVIDIAATDMGYGLYPIVTLKTATGEVAIHAFHTVLRRELARRRPKVGDQLDITYLGKQSGRDRGYDGYRVRSDRDAQGYDWNRDLSEEERDVAPDVPIEPEPIPGPETPVAASTPDDDDLPF